MQVMDEVVQEITAERARREDCKDAPGVGTTVQY